MTAGPTGSMASVERRESAPAGSAGRSRRTGGVHRQHGSSFRLAVDVAAALEAEARATGRSKVAIVEQVLRDRYELAA